MECDVKGCKKPRMGDYFCEDHIDPDLKPPIKPPVLKAKGRND